MKASNHKLLLGAHLSISDGFSDAIIKGESIGCTCIQIFTKSNRQWAAKPIAQETAQQFQKQQNSSDIRTVLAHATYLINICSENTLIADKSTEALAMELERCNILGIPYLVLHPGSKGDMSENQAIKTVSKNLDKAFEHTKSNTKILLETMAGQGSSIGNSFEQLAEIINSTSNNNRLGICFDTCHAFAAGYDFRTQRTYDDMWKKFDQVLGFNLLKAMHINDSKKELGSGVDRHEHVGLGKIGLDAFKMIFNDPKLFDVPKILETPKDNGLLDDAKNIKTIVGLIEEKNNFLFKNTKFSSLI